MTQEQILDNMKEFLNQRVLIMKPNKNHGKQGETIRAEITKSKKRAAIIVKLDEGKEIEVYDGSQLFFIIQLI